MNDRTPVKANIIRYWRDDRIDQGCVSERTDLAANIPCPGSAADAFEDELLKLGVPFGIAERASEIFDDFCTLESYRRAADGIRELLLKIGQTKTGKTPEFRAILSIFSPGRTLDEIANEAGLSKQSVHYHREKLREFFDTAPAFVAKEKL